MGRLIMGVIVVLLFGRFAVVPAYAAEYYLAPNGSDGASGSSAHPWQSLNHALAATNDGDVVNILAGTYDLNHARIELGHSLTLIGENKQSTQIINGQEINFHDSLTIKNLTFSNWSSSSYDSAVFRPEYGYTERFGSVKGTFADIDGFLIENCVFDNVHGIVQSRHSYGVLTNVDIINNQFLDVINTTSVYAIVISHGEISQVTIENNVFDTIYTQDHSANAFGILIGDDIAHQAYESDPSKPIPRYVNVRNNAISHLYGGNVYDPSRYYPSTRAVMLYGRNLYVDGNLITDLGDACSDCPKNCVYIKGSDSQITNNVLHDCSAVARTGSADITFKGSGNGGNVIAGNHVSSSQTMGNNTFYVKGGVTIEHNYVEATADSQLLYSYDAVNETVVVTDNYFYTSNASPALFLWDVGGGQISDNVMINPNGHNIQLLSSASSVSVYDNLECTSASCPAIDPPHPSCQNTGNYCVTSCEATRLQEHDQSCNPNTVCCDEYHFSVYEPSPVTGDVDNDEDVDVFDYFELLLDYGGLLSVSVDLFDIHTLIQHL
jgi:hypothetical protein